MNKKNSGRRRNILREEVQRLTQAEKTDTQTHTPMLTTPSDRQTDRQTRAPGQTHDSHYQQSSNLSLARITAHANHAQPHQCRQVEAGLEAAERGFTPGV